MTAKASEGAVRAAAYMFDSEDAKIYVHGYSHGWYSLPQVAELIDTLAVQPERDRALEEAAAKVQEFFDRWKQCSCGAIDEKWIAKKAGKMYNTESGHAIDCVMDDLFELVRAIRSLKGGK